jgi:hypothetical protein
MQNVWAEISGKIRHHATVRADFPAASTAASLFPGFAEDGRTAQGKDDDFFAGDGADVMVKAQDLGAGDIGD